VSPFWFKKLNLKNDLWTSPYLKDANVIVSHVDNKIDYAGPESLFGFTVVSVLEAVKQTLEPYIKLGKINQIHTPVFGGHIKMLAAKRGDFVSTSLTIAQYMISKFNLTKKLYISSRPDDNYTRHFLVLNGRKDIQLFLNQTIFKMATDPIWLAVLEKFGAADLRVAKPESQ
ncbi:MAG: hypothetical protein V7727_14705, partial [Sneathiella sp.]